MANEKIASRLILADGSTYSIGTTGLNENVAVKLSAPTSENWASKVIVVQNITQATSEEYALSALGECKFTIPMGNVYSIVYPVLSNYKQPINPTFTATLASRSIDYTYSNEDVMYEQINISAQVVGGDVSELEGKVVSALSDNGNAYAAEFSNGRLVLRIPYGEKYKITLPALDGYIHDGNYIQMTAGIPSRFIYIHYSDGLIGCYGLDDDGNQYTIDDIKALEDKSIIVAAAYNDAQLAIADRGDGTTGCGFMWKIGETIAKEQWAVSAVEFDKTRLPFVTSGAVGFQNCAGARYTQYIIEIGDELSVATPAATNCRNSTITIGGVTRNGFLPAYGQLIRLALNYSAVQALYNALGKTVPTLTSGAWWTSCQGSAQNAVFMYNCGFRNDNSKSNSFSVLRVYDL